VRYALEGSVRRVGEAITINAQLISTETGAHAWAERFEGERAKLGQLQVEAVARLANALHLELIKAESLRALRERPDNPDAVDLVMKAELAVLRADNKKASEEFEQALKLDPNLTRAQAGLAFALANLANYPGATDRDAYLDRAERLAIMLYRMTRFSSSPKPGSSPTRNKPRRRSSKRTQLSRAIQTMPKRTAPVRFGRGLPDAPRRG
jgi:adenylate cyclase